MQTLDENLKFLNQFQEACSIGDLVTKVFDEISKHKTTKSLFKTQLFRGLSIVDLLEDSERQEIDKKESIAFAKSAEYKIGTVFTQTNFPSFWL